MTVHDETIAKIRQLPESLVEEVNDSIDLLLMKQSQASASAGASLEWIVLEIEKIPQEFWPNLLEMIRLYRESLTMKAAPSDSWAKVIDEIKNPDPVLEASRQKALSELLRQWEEEGDEIEQKETWEILSQALDRGGVSI